jgi:hypothetical protein
MTMDNKLSCPSNLNSALPVCVSEDIQGDSNFPQGCQISPDGLCVLTSTSSDNYLRLYNVPQERHHNNALSNSVSNETKAYDIVNEEEKIQPLTAIEKQRTNSSNRNLNAIPWKTSLFAREGDSIRSYCWFPLMNSYHPSSCAFLATSR